MTLIQLIAIYISANPGGEGKTTLTLLFEAILELLGRPVSLVDIDEGNGSLSISRGAGLGLEHGSGARTASLRRSQERKRCDGLRSEPDGLRCACYQAFLCA